MELKRTDNEELEKLDWLNDESRFTDLGAVDELAVVLLGATLLDLISPTTTPLAGMTGAFELREFWYGAAPESWAADTMFQPLDFMMGYALMNDLTH